MFELEEDFIPLSEPSISGNEWKYVKECLDYGWVSSAGRFVDLFEKEIADFVKAKHAVACVNGTSALHIAYLVSGIQSNDEVMVPTLTFIAPVNAVRYCWGYPVFMDSDPETLGMDPEKVADFLENACEIRDDGHAYNLRSGRRVKACIPVHIFGHPVDMDPLLEVCSRYNIDVIEDATESLGSKYKGRYTGILGRLGCYSFNGNKIITSGGGGMIVSDDEEVITRARHLSTQAKVSGLEYRHDEIGYNYRLTNLQAALGVAQLEQLPRFVEIKRKNASIFKNYFDEVKGVKFFVERDWAESNCWFYTIFVSPEKRIPLIKYLNAEGVECRPIWQPVHTQPMYLGEETYRIESALKIYDSGINLPCSVTLSEDKIHKVASLISEFPDL